MNFTVFVWVCMIDINFCCDINLKSLKPPRSLYWMVEHRPLRLNIYVRYHACERFKCVQSGSKWPRNGGEWHDDMVYRLECSNIGNYSFTID